MSADVCLILEGSYPYVRGGVAAWTHELITRQDHLRFHLVSLLPRDEKPEQQYQLPDNVTGLTNIHLQRILPGRNLSHSEGEALFNALHDPLVHLTTDIAKVEDFEQMRRAMSRHNGTIGAEALLNSEPAFALIVKMYEERFAESSMLDYFWSWRAVVAALYSLLLPKLPDAKVYHALSTGYAGLLLARAKLEKKRPALLTEHGIYTNERRIEIALADWLTETSIKALTIDHTRHSLRDFWMETFTNYSRVAYATADRIITLFAGNQQAQTADGADPAKMAIIPNGVDIERFAALPRKPHERPTVAFIGRVVPIKDVKTFIRAVAALRSRMPDIRALVLGPTDEDPKYVAECQAMVEHYALSAQVEFLGQVRVDDYMPEIDVVIFSSLSEAQPLVILEAGACGIPVVATDVGACRELIMGRIDETPRLGPGGAVVPLSSPQSLADAAFRLLTDRDYYQACSNALRERIATWYDKRQQMQSYKALYEQCMA
ncbi:MAG: GT4 family glycosyltransferase PelF [Alphaproteobacteria bacterium]|nr:GT4 family glycosyltransferase PelF [Alphaproteobacteria bacterium]